MSDTRDKLLDTALMLFAQRGYEAIGVQEIVEKAGVTKPTLYHYFGNKQGLLAAALTRDFEALSTCVQDAARYSGDLPLSLRRVVAAHFEYASRRPMFYRVMLGMWFAPLEGETSQLILPLVERHQLTIEKLFVEATRQHGNMRGRHRQYAATLLGTINTFIGVFFHGYVKLDDSLTDRVVHQFSHGIYS